MRANRKKSSESSRFKKRETMFSSSSSSDEEITTGCRSCRSTSREQFGTSAIEVDQPTVQESARREENPFSFKHFLKGGTQTNYYNTGARPKVYSSPTPSPNNVEKDSGVYSRNPTELPDFVQDHLVVEQCYLNHEPAQQVMVDVDNLPDFALNSVQLKQARLRKQSKKREPAVLSDLSYNASGTLVERMHRRNLSGANPTCLAHLDLPTFDRQNVETTERPESSGFPLDLPIPVLESDPSSNAAGRDGSATNESNVPKSLPDFLNDGLLHNRTSLSTDPGCTSNTAESTERRLLLENESLRHELEVAWKQINEKSRRIQALESELASRKEVENEETAHLEKAIEQVEVNLKCSKTRADHAESTVNLLQKEVKTLTVEISQLRLENQKLRAAMPSRSGNEQESPTNVVQRVRRLAGDLRTAALTADVTLRQLMSGVDNLRVLASTLENVDRIEDRTKDFLPDFDEENATGPAL